MLFLCRHRPSHGPSGPVALCLQPVHPSVCACICACPGGCVLHCLDCNQLPNSHVTCLICYLFCCSRSCRVAALLCRLSNSHVNCLNDATGVDLSPVLPAVRARATCDGDAAVGHMAAGSPATASQQQRASLSTLTILLQRRRRRRTVRVVIRGPFDK